MIAAGYLLKRVKPPPGWLSAPHVIDVCSVADCVNDDLVNVQAAWKHNGFGVANSPKVLMQLVRSAAIDTSDSRLFYYEAYEQELESDGWTFDPADWRTVSPASSSIEETAPASPGANLKPIGYDVVVFGDFLEHSPLSCNSVAETVSVNEHCLFDSLDQAIAAINSGAFGGGCEEGVYKIFSVNLVTDR